MINGAEKTRKSEHDMAFFKLLLKFILFAYFITTYYFILLIA